MAVSVFPERMNKLDPEDVNTSLRAIENYISYITERTEYALTNTFRTTTNLGGASKEAALALEELSDNIRAFEDETRSALTDKVDKVDGMGLSHNDYTDAEKSKLDNIEADAEVNVIETVKQNGTALPVTDKAVNVTVPTAVSELINDSGYQNAQQVQAMVDTGLASLFIADSYGPAALVAFDGGQGGLPVKSCAVDVGAGVSSANVYMAGKNLLNFAGYTITKREYGITFTLVTNADGSLQKIVANGTDAATSGFSQIYISIPQSVAKHFAGKKLGGGHSDNLFIQIENVYSPYTVFAKDTGNGATIAAGVASAAMVNIMIRVARGATLNSAEVYPMIRDADADDGYVPYQGKSWTYDPATGGLTPAVMASLAGINHIWSDQGDVTVEYGAFMAALQSEIEKLQEGGT